MEYFLLPEDCWKVLVDEFKLKDGQEPIARKVIERGRIIKHCKVEVYYPAFLLAENSRPEKTVEKKFSRCDLLSKIHKTMRDIFQIPHNVATRLWTKYPGRIFEKLSNLEMTIQDSSLWYEQVILIEKQNADGTWERDTERATSQKILVKSTKRASNTEISEILGKELKCYICKSGPKAGKSLQWYRCLSMHQICWVCRKVKTEKIKKCSCGKAISDEYCKMTEAILKSKSMRFMCKNEERGCQQILNEESTILHESECIYRMVKCPNPNCKSKVPFHELLEHMAPKCIVNDFSQKDNEKWIQKYSLKSEWKAIRPFKHEIDRKVFFSLGRMIDETFYWWVQIVGSKYEAKNYYYTLEFHGTDPEVCNVYSGQVFPIDETYETITKGFKCLGINKNVMRMQFVGPDEDFSYSVSIRNMKEEAKDDNVESGISDDE